MAVYSGGGAPTQLPLQGAALSLPPPALRLRQTPCPKCSRSVDSGSLNLASCFVNETIVSGVIPICGNLAQTSIPSRLDWPNILHQTRPVGLFLTHISGAEEVPGLTRVFFGWHFVPGLGNSLLLGRQITEAGYLSISSLKDRTLKIPLMQG